MPYYDHFFGPPKTNNQTKKHQILKILTEPRMQWGTFLSQIEKIDVKANIFVLLTVNSISQTKTLIIQYYSIPK